MNYHINPHSSRLIHYPNFIIHAIHFVPTPRDYWFIPKFSNDMISHREHAIIVYNCSVYPFTLAGNFVHNLQRSTHFSFAHTRKQLDIVSLKWKLQHRNVRMIQAHGLISTCLHYSTPLPTNRKQLFNAVVYGCKVYSCWPRPSVNTIALFMSYVIYVTC